MELAYVERGLRKALEHAQFLATDRKDLEEIYRNKIHARAARKVMRNEGIEDTLKALEKIDIPQGSKFRNPGEAVGYLLGMHAAINGKRGVENIVQTVKHLSHLPPDVAAEILARYIIPHAIPPHSVVKNPEIITPQRKILVRMVLRAVGNSLPEITKKMLMEAKISKGDLDEDELRRRLEIVRRGRAALNAAMSELPDNPEKAREHIEEHINRLHSENVDIHDHYSNVIKALERGNTAEAKMYLKMIEYGQRNHEEQLRERLEKIMHGKMERSEAIKLLATTSGRERLLGLAHEIDLRDVNSTKHWEEFSEREMKWIERILAKNDAKIQHVENLQRLFRQNSVRKIVKKAMVWSRKMGQETEAVEKLVWGIASKDPTIMKLVENYGKKSNGIGDLLRKISKSEENGKRAAGGI